MAWYGLVWWDAWGTMVKHIHFLKQCFWFSLLWPTCQDFLIPLRHLSKIQCRIVFFCPCALKWLFLKNARSLLETHWSVVYLPLWKIWVRQLGSLFTIYGKTCSKPPTSTVQFVALCHMSDNHSPAEIAGGEVFCKCDNREPKERVAWNSLIFFVLIGFGTKT